MSDEKRKAGLTKPFPLFEVRSFRQHQMGLGTDLGSGTMKFQGSISGFMLNCKGLKHMLFRTCNCFFDNSVHLSSGTILDVGRMSDGFEPI